MKTSNKEEEEPHFVKRDKFAITAEYKQWFADIKSRLRNSQIKAAIKVNSTLLEFYWSLGRDIVKMKAEQAWGSGTMDVRSCQPPFSNFSASPPKACCLRAARRKAGSRAVRYGVRSQKELHPLFISAILKKTSLEGMGLWISWYSPIPMGLWPL